MKINNPTLKTDKIGIAASTLCMLHCIATPFLFLVHTCSASYTDQPLHWWATLDFLFLFISFFAIHHSSKHTSKTWLKYGMWIAGVSLFATILNESMQLVYLFQHAKYIPASILILLHTYNLRTKS